MGGVWCSSSHLLPVVPGTRAERLVSAWVSGGAVPAFELFEREWQHGLGGVEGGKVIKAGKGPQLGTEAGRGGVVATGAGYPSSRRRDGYPRTVSGLIRRPTGSLW